MANLEDEQAPADAHAATTSGLIFVSDASAEAERLTVALRSRGYLTIDVPLGLLAARTAVQKPALVLCDADAAGVLDVIEMLRAAHLQNVQLIFLGDPEGTISSDSARLKGLAQAVFTRPVEVYALLRKVEAVIGAPPEGAASGPMFPAARAPVLVAAARKPYMVDASHPGVEPRNAPRAAERAPAPPEPPGLDSIEKWKLTDVWASIGESQRDIEPGRQLSLLPETSSLRADNQRSLVSQELASLLREAEQRLENKPLRDLRKQRLSPEAEVDAVLPPDILAALDEPLDDDDDFELDVGPGTKSGSEGGGTSPGTQGEQGPKPEAAAESQNRATNPGGVAVVSPSEPAPNPRPPDDLPPTDPPPTPVAAPMTPIPGSLGFPAAVTAVGDPDERELTGDEPSTNPPPPTGFARDAGNDASPSTPSGPIPTSRPPRLQARRTFALSDDDEPKGLAAPPLPRPLAAAPVGFPRPLGDGIARSSFARVVRQRLSGALAFENTQGIRRVVFRDGDFVTAASGVEEESLIAFLAERGDLGPEVAAQLKRKLPPFGRHAGAALIANGHLKQDELWSVLRAHAEWLVGRLVRLEHGQVDWEPEVPERLRTEPAVFGGSTGAEVFVETLRRVAPPERSLSHLGGGNVKLAHGEQFDLLSECALSAEESELVRRAPLVTLEEALAGGAPGDFATVCLALVELGVLAHVAVAHRSAPVLERAAVDPLDDQALRARVVARYALVEEGDYFALLGVPRTATEYEIKKAHENLKIELQPARVLTARNADLRERLETILEVLDEAFEVLGNQLRRDRYRRALEATPG